jgi:hypothetical protein
VGLGKCFAAGGLLAGICAGHDALAAELRWSGPEDCDWSAHVVEQVEAQIDRSLAQVDGIDFEIRVSRADGGGWRMTLVSVERPSGERRQRDLTGESCGEVANAGAVALAMAIREQAEMALREPAPPVNKPLLRAKPAPRHAKPAPPPPKPSRTVPLTPTVTAGAVLDVGALPNPTLGAELEAGVARRALYLGVLGDFFTPSRTDAESGRGGEFQLWAAGAVVGLTRPVARFAVVLRAGYEIGVLTGRGRGVTDPRSETTLWQALRADLGLRVPFGNGFAGVLRGGAVVPLERREFLLDGSDVVHRPAALGARVSAGLSVDF